MTIHLLNVKVIYYKLVGPSSKHIAQKELTYGSGTIGHVAWYFKHEGHVFEINFVLQKVLQTPSSHIK